MVVKFGSKPEKMN